MNATRWTTRALALLAAILLTACAAAAPTTPTPDPLTAAEAHIARREFSAALEILRQQMTAQPTVAIFPQKMGEIYLRQHRWDEAARAFSTALATDPQSVPALLGRAEAYLQLRDAASARNDAHTAVAFGGGAAAQVLLGRGFLQTQNYADARAAFSAAAGNPQAAWYLAGLALADDPSAGLARLSALPDSPKRDYLLAALDGVPPDAVAGTAGIAFIQLNEWELAHAALSAAVHSDPDRAEWWAFLGRAQTMLDLPALESFRRAQTLDPSLTLVSYFRGLYLRRKGLPSAALDEFLAAMDADPKNIGVAIETAETLVQLGDYPSAAAWYQSVVQADPKNTDYLRLLVEFHVQHGYRVAEDGLPAAERLAALLPDDPHALDLLGWAKFQTGDIGGAETDVRRAVALSPDDVAARFHLGRILLALHRDAEARAEFIHVVDWDTTGIYRPRALAMINEQ